MSPFVAPAFSFSFLARLNTLENRGMIYFAPCNSAPITTPLRACEFLPAADAQMSSNSNVSSPDVVVDPPNDATRTTASHHSSGASDPQSSPVDRIVVGCPNCRATLRVRRVYLGNSVRCKNCDQIFLFEESPDSALKPAGDLPHATRTQLTDDQPQANGGSVRTDQPYERLMGQHDRLLHEHGDLKSKYEVLEVENERLHAARRELESRKQTAIDEIEQLRKTLAERDQAMLEQSERHRTALEGERLARERVDQVFGESLRRVRAEHRFTEAARKHFQDECLEMAAALEKLRSDYQLRLEAEQMKQKTLTDELLSLRAESDEATRLANQLFVMKTNPAEQNPAPNPELEAARAQVEDLTQWLMICERVNREMAEILSGLGIRMSLPVRSSER
jgi:hypothetical protein